MSDPAEGSIVRRSGEGWMFTIDARHAPDYLRYTVEGIPCQRMIEQTALELIQLGDWLIGPDAPFPPIIADLRRIGSGKLGVATFQWASSQAIRRVNILIVVFDPDLQTPQGYKAFLRLAAIALPRAEIAYSLEEAFERIGVTPPEPD